MTCLLLGEKYFRQICDLSAELRQSARLKPIWFLSSPFEDPNTLYQWCPIMCHGGPRACRPPPQPTTSPADFTN
uniref:Uncharacterized protein n=1 Tax=Anguilla anguilla TaxID=7936 RepID=A0A0E9WJ89_ANGAN